LEGKEKKYLKGGVLEIEQVKLSFPFKSWRQVWLAFFSRQFLLTTVYPAISW